MSTITRYMFWIVLFIAPMGAYADQNDERLDTLFEQLKEAESDSVAFVLEASIWNIWLETENSEADDLMEKGMVQMNRRELDDAIDTFTRLVEIAPDFAEGWNKRATAYFLQDRAADSVRDVQKTLALEPRHFGAISGMGLMFMGKGDFEGALRAFTDVLEIHPMSPSARVHAEALKERIRSQQI